MSAEARARASEAFDAGDYRRSLRTAEEALQEAPDDVGLLVLAGRAALELDSDQATVYLRKATELAGDDASAWQQLGVALATEGRNSEAEDAFRRAVELDPNDQVSLTHLGHTALISGKQDEGVELLDRAASTGAGSSSAAISLVEMYRSFGQYDQALGHAARIAEAAQDDELAWLDVGELSLLVGNLDRAAAAFARLRELDEIPGHDVYPLHGLIAVELARDGWERAGALSEQASAVQAHGVSTQVQAFVDAQLGVESSTPTPSRERVDELLRASLDDYRRILGEDRRLTVGGNLG